MRETCLTEVSTAGLLVLLDADVLELDGHGRPGVHLQGEDAGEGAVFGIVVDDVDGLHAVDVVLQVVAAGDDDVIVPVTLLAGGGDGGVVTEVADDLGDAVFADFDLVARPQAR